MIAPTSIAPGLALKEGLQRLLWIGKYMPHLAGAVSLVRSCKKLGPCQTRLQVPCKGAQEAWEGTGGRQGEGRAGGGGGRNSMPWQ